MSAECVRNPSLSRVWSADASTPLCFGIDPASNRFHGVNAPGNRLGVAPGARVFRRIAQMLRGASETALMKTLKSAAHSRGLFTARARKEPKGRPFLVQHVRGMFDFECSAKFHGQFGRPFTINLSHLVQQELQERQHPIAAIGHDALFETLQGKVYHGWHLIGWRPGESAKSVANDCGRPKRQMTTARLRGFPKKVMDAITQFTPEIARHLSRIHRVG